MIVQIAPTQEARVQQQQRARAEGVPVGGTPAESPFAGVSATSGFETFHLVMTLWQSQFGSNLATVNWVLQDTALSLLREMLMLLDLAARAGTDDDKRAADRLQRRCFSVCCTA